MSIDCKLYQNPVTPAFFLDEAIPLVQDRKLVKLLSRYRDARCLTYRDAVIILTQLLPKSVYNHWPSVGLLPPLDISSLTSFNNSFSAEWYYFNVNGFVEHNGSLRRFYMLRVLKRLRTKHTAGTENLPWLMSDMVSVFIENGPHITEHVCAPCYSDAVHNPAVDGPYFSISSEPLQIRYNAGRVPAQSGTAPYLALKFHEGHLASSFSFEKTRLTIHCVCNKPVLLQGAALNGLDPSSSNFVSRVSGASYLYFSWPSWTLDVSMVSTIVHGAASYQVAPCEFELWLDHQGGVAKEPGSTLVEQFAIFSGARPLVFPGWNWFSVQLKDNTQFTGYSNKPWGNDVADNKQMLQGTWSGSGGHLSWVRGTKTIDEWWESPDSGTPFGTAYTLDLGDKGTYVLKGIMDDQRAPQEGIEQYEGGCDVFRDGVKVGVGNLECIGWPSIAERLKYVSASLSTPLQNHEIDALTQVLNPSMTALIVVLCLCWLVLSGATYWALLRMFARKQHRPVSLSAPFVYYTLPIALVTVTLLINIVCALLKRALCNKSWTCSAGKSTGCLFHCSG